MSPDTEGAGVLGLNGEEDQRTGGWQAFWAAPPIDPSREMAAYESLWLGEKAWFKSIASLFEENPGAVPSELVPPEAVDEAWHALIAAHGLARMHALGLRIHGTLDYPSKLRDAKYPVELLYFRGDWTLVDSPSVAVVGTRNPTDEGVENTQRIARSLVHHGYTVVSGLAKGVDTAAHQAAIAAGGRTIGVIGTPIFEAYPKENAELQERIACEHLLISQVPLLRYARQNFRVNRFFFPERNITMSALTKATVIVEAGNTSGTLIQAQAALDQGRKLFILDSCFRRADLTWPARFEARGAVRVRKPGDIVDALAVGTTTEH